jgi:hypothetical protein
MSTVSNDPKFNVVFVSRPSESPGTLNAFALGLLGSAPDLARKLGVELEHVTLQARTPSGGYVQVRLERDK